MAMQMMFTGKGKVGSVSIGGKSFSLKKLQWRTPSEHTINGKRHPLEVQLVHESDAGTGELAIIAILYKVGAPDSFYFQLKRELAELAGDRCNYGVEDASSPMGLVHLRSLQKRTGSYFRYMGSLTAPPCTENVYWNVLGKVRQMTKEQLDMLLAPLPPAARQNARPVQPLNGRVVTFYNPPNSTISFQM
jgi:carbonic anhydrase